MTVNGESSPLFFVSPGQINAQLPVDLKLGQATIVVKSGGLTSNAAAFTIPATGPGIFTFVENGKTRAVVQNADQGINSSTKPAKVGDVLVAYFTGGGPVQNGGLGTGTPAPVGLSRVTNSNSATVSGKQALLSYVGLTPRLVGLYQANFQVPNVAAGDHPLILTIGGQASNAPLITIK